MIAVGVVASRRARLAVIRRLNREDLRRTTVQSLAIATAIAATLLWWHLLAGDAPDIYVFLYIPLVLAATVCCYAWSKRSARWASAALCLALLATIALPFLGLGIPGAAYFLVLPALVGAGVIHPAAGMVCAVVAIVLIRAGSSPEAWLAPAGLVAATGAGAWLILHPLYSVLEWSWQRSADATYLAEVLRDRQGELNNAIAALDLANRLLQRSNHELALARQEAEAARHLKEEFATNISHELRTPLNIILGFTEIMHHSPEIYGLAKWPATLRRDVTEIYRSARYLSDMIDDILDLARVEAASMPVRREPTNLATVIEEAAEIARGLLRDRPVQLLVRLQPHLPQLLIDRARIRQVLLNLLTNASRYTESGSISVSAVQKGEEVVITVVDTGMGIPADQLQAIFDEFRQVDAWRRPENEGKGLGLAIAKRFVQLHGGSIWAESKVGEGSTFYVSLPIARKDFSRLRQSQPTPLPADPYAPCLVVVGENEGASAYLRRHLDGYEVHRVAEPECLPEMVAKWHPRALLVSSPPGEGQVPGWLAQLAPGVPIITCPLPVAAPLADHGRFRACLSKPVSNQELLSALASVVPGGEVLVVDDDRAFVQLVLRMLQAGDHRNPASPRPYRVRWAYNGAEALQKMRASRPDVVLLDMIMPEMDGPTLAQAMSEDPALAHIPIIAVSAAGMPEEETPPTGVTLSVTSSRGFTEKELLGMISDTLQHIRADYVMHKA